MEMRIKGALKLDKQLSALIISRAKSKRILGRSGRTVATSSKKRITAQKEVGGAAFRPRKDKANRRKMLLGLRRQIRVRFHGEAVVVFVRRGPAARIARQQQEGFTEQVTAAVLQERERKRNRARRQSSLSGKGFTDSAGPMASRRQARRLKEIGFRKTQRWIMEHFSKRLAGFIIRKEEGRTPKGAWTIVLPARPFLGASTEDVAAVAAIVREEILRGIP